MTTRQTSTPSKRPWTRESPADSLSPIHALHAPNGRNGVNLRLRCVMECVCPRLTHTHAQNACDPHTGTRHARPTGSSSPTGMTTSEHPPHARPSSPLPEKNRTHSLCHLPSPRFRHKTPVLGPCAHFHPLSSSPPNTTLHPVQVHTKPRVVRKEGQVQPDDALLESWAAQVRANMPFATHPHPCAA
jgi:hypothetical protein